MSRITKIINHTTEIVLAEDIKIVVSSTNKYKNEFGEEFILMPIYYYDFDSDSDKIYEYSAIFISDLYKSETSLKIDDKFVDGAVLHKGKLHYFTNNKNEDYITLYEMII